MMTETTAQLALSPAALRRQNRDYRCSGGISQENRTLGFTPAFMDLETGIVYPARFADGRRAPMHLLDGLPDELVVTRLASGTVVEVKESVVAGFVGRCRFFTRAQAARATRLISRLAARRYDAPLDELSATQH